MKERHYSFRPLAPLLSSGYLPGKPTRNVSWNAGQEVRLVFHEILKPFSYRTL
jgi:hypothetical protein